ncbi:alpha-centractin-like, partial [Manduca sexta]|uniref:alpha-centractin-like n=1 Tax=Manduca sexta TaxID=7130 RepID=UPI001890784A
LHEVLMFAIQKSDMDLRKVLYQNIVLSGGSTLFRGFGDRLLAEIRRLAPGNQEDQVDSGAGTLISAPQERLYSTWIGGSILASLDTFRKMWVSKREYDEEDTAPCTENILKCYIYIIKSDECMKSV